MADTEVLTSTISDFGREDLNESRTCRPNSYGSSSGGQTTSSEEDRTSDEVMGDNHETSVLAQYINSTASRTQMMEGVSSDVNSTPPSNSRRNSGSPASFDEKGFDRTSQQEAPPVGLSILTIPTNIDSVTESLVERLTKTVEQLRIEKQVLVSTVLKISRERDEDQKHNKREISMLTKEVDALKAKCDEYARAQPLLESAVEEVLRGNITEDGLPAIDDVVVDGCRAVIAEIYPCAISNSGSGEKDREGLDIFIDHSNLNAMLETNLPVGTSIPRTLEEEEQRQIESTRSPSRVSVSPSLSRKSSGERVAGLRSSGSSGELTAAKISKLPESYFGERGNLKASGGSSNSLNIANTGGSAVIDHRMSPSTRSFSSHVSMDSLRRRSMMETRIADDEDDRDDQSIISSISEHVSSDQQFRGSPRRSRSQSGSRSRKECICGAYRPRKVKPHKPSNYRYYDDEGNCIPIVSESKPHEDISTLEDKSAETTAVGTSMAADAPEGGTETKGQEDDKKIGYWGSLFGFK